MKNQYFQITFNPEDGTIVSIKHPEDAFHMNWCAEDAQWGWIHCINRDQVHGCNNDRQREMTLQHFEENDSESLAVYSNEMVEVRVERSFRKNGNFAERYTVRNLRDADVFLGQDNFGVEVPLNDKYTFADDCMTNRCHAHIWCGHHTAYINALRMGTSDTNLGLVLTRGALDSYSVLHKFYPDASYRGRFVLNSAAFSLSGDETYVLEWELFWHSGNEDFARIASQIPAFIGINAENETVFQGEEIRFSARLPFRAEKIEVSCQDNAIEFSYENQVIKAAFCPDKTGEYRVWIQADGVRTYADFIVVPPLAEIIEKRIAFIIDKQQYHKPESPLDGAFLIYDTEDERLVFDDANPDHNACRERIGMALLMAKYLQTHTNPKVKTALDDYLCFLMREFYDEATGEVFNSVRKKRDQVRLYNAPWVVTLFTEMYLLTKDKAYLQHIIKILQVYYAGGGSRFYPNGFSMYQTLRAFREAGCTQEEKQVYTYFKEHVDTMKKIGTSYPKHEVNYEQTIVTPAAAFISEMGRVCGDEEYLREAKKHIAVLERFNGHQPSFHLNEIPIRYWDDFWFGKSRMFGDTFPHYWSCLTARAYMDYYYISKDTRYRDAANRCLRNCLCLFKEEGKGSCAYVYPYAIDGKKGQFYDAWANDQDFALYFSMGC